MKKIVIVLLIFFLSCNEKDKTNNLVDILVMLTPRSGHTDPPKDFGQRDKIMTILQFFSKTFPLQFYSMGSMYQSI